MQLLAEETAEISCTVEAAYGLVSNLERFGEWFPGVVAIESANRLEHAAVGKQYLETVSIPLRGTRKVGITVKEAEANRLLVTEGTLPPLMPRMEILFRSLGPGSCRVTWRMLSRNDGWLARATIVPLARSVVRKRAAVGLARLKKTLEGR
jgi:Polyketide cyclase / dehydrase and lipid transport